MFATYRDTPVMDHVIECVSCVCGPERMWNLRVLPFRVAMARCRSRCWRGEIGKRDGITTRWAKARVSSNLTASTAALLTRPLDYGTVKYGL